MECLGGYGHSADSPDPAKQANLLAGTFRPIVRHIANAPRERIS